MNDLRDLKAIAEACKEHQPLRFMRSHGALYIRNDNGIVFDVHQNRSFPEFMAQNKDYADLVLAANPATVLALIAENEILRANLREVKDAKLGLSWAIGEIMGERDRLKVENEALRAKLENPDPILIQCLDAAIAEQDQLEKDAARYRWTSTEGNWVARMFGKWRAHIGAYGDASPTEWYETREEAIDAAMSKAVQS